MPYLGLETIKQGSSAECIKDIFTIHFPTAQTVLDTTYGAGRFWKWDHVLLITGVDIDPPGPVTTIADYRNLPFREGQFDVMVFDPMFIFSRGLRAVIGTKRQFMGAEAVAYEGRTWQKQNIARPRNPKDLLDNHYRRIFEQRGLATQGLICKGQNLVTGTSRDMWMVNVINLAREIGLGDPQDYLIQHSPAARMRDPRWKHQCNFRTAECFYLIWKW